MEMPETMACARRSNILEHTLQTSLPSCIAHAPRHKADAHGLHCEVMKKLHPNVWLQAPRNGRGPGEGRARATQAGDEGSQWGQASNGHRWCSPRAARQSPRPPHPCSSLTVSCARSPAPPPGAPHLNPLIGRSSSRLPSAQRRCDCAAPVSAGLAGRGGWVVGWGTRGSGTCGRMRQDRQATQPGQPSKRQKGSLRGAEGCPITYACAACTAHAGGGGRAASQPPLPTPRPAAHR